jgi:hypothetical protein
MAAAPIQPSAGVVAATAAAPVVAAAPVAAAVAPPAAATVSASVAAPVTAPVPVQSSTETPANKVFIVEDDATTPRAQASNPSPLETASSASVAPAAAPANPAPALTNIAPAVEASEVSQAYEAPVTPRTPMHPSAIAAAAAGPILSPAELAGLLAGSRPTTQQTRPVSSHDGPDHPAAAGLADLTPQQLTRMISASRGSSHGTGSRPVTSAGIGGGSRPLTSGMGANSRPMTSADASNAPDHPAAASIAELSRSQLQELISKPTTPVAASRRSTLNLHIPAPSMSTIQAVPAGAGTGSSSSSAQPLTPQRGDDIQAYVENSPSPRSAKVPVGPSTAPGRHPGVPITAFHTPARIPETSRRAVSEDPVQRFSASPSEAQQQQQPPSSGGRRRSGVLEQLPAVHSRRGSRVGSSTSDALLPGAIVSPEQQGQSRSRRNSLSQAGHFLPPLNNSTPSHQGASGAGTSTAKSPPSASLAISPNPSPSNPSQLSGGPNSTASDRGNITPSGGAASPSEGRTTAKSPGTANSNLAGTASRRMASPVAPTSTLASQQVVQTSQLDPSRPSMLDGRSRWRWTVAMLPGVLLLLFAIIYLFTALDGYTVLNLKENQLIQVGLILHGVGILLLLIVLVLILIYATPFHGGTGLLYQFGLTCSMLGTAAWIQDQSKDHVTEIFWNGVIGMFQLQLLGCALLFLVFAAWLHTAPHRSTQRVLVVLEGLDLSALSRDIRAMKGMHAELIHAAQVQAGFPNALAPSPTSPSQGGGYGNTSAWDTNRPMTGQTQGEIRPTTGGGRPLTGSRDVDLVTYGTYSYAGAIPVPSSGGAAPSHHANVSVSGYSESDSTASNQQALTSSVKAKKAEKRKKKDRATLGNSSQFLSVNGTTVNAAPSMDGAPGYANSENLALRPSHDRGKSVEMNAMKALMSANLELQAKLAAAESRGPSSGRVADGTASYKGPAFQ